MPAKSPAMVSERRLFVLLAAWKKAAGIELGRVCVNIRIHVGLIDVNSGKGTLWYDLSCAPNFDVLAADILAERCSHSYDSDGLVKTKVGQWEVMLPVINAQLAENINRVLLRAGLMLSNCAVDFGAHLTHPMGIQSEKAKHPCSIISRIQLAREEGEDDELEDRCHH